MLEPDLYRRASAFIDDVAASIDKKSFSVFLMQEVRNTIAEVALANRAEVKEDGVFERNMCVVEDGDRFQKIRGKPNDFSWRERVVGVVAEIGEGVSDKRRDFPRCRLIEVYVGTKHCREVGGHFESTCLFLGRDARDERCRDETGEKRFKSRRSREDFPCE